MELDLGIFWYPVHLLNVPERFFSSLDEFFKEIL